MEESERQLHCYALEDLDHTRKFYLAFGYSAVDAAEKLIAKIGGPNDVDRFSVSDSVLVTDDTHIMLSKYWPHFTSHPCRHSRD